MISFYKGLITCLAPVLRLYLHRRIRFNKEDPVRLSERWGVSALPRPKGPILWVHAVSVGESFSILPVLVRLRQDFPEITPLMTTGTTSAARLMEKRLPAGCIHQYIPIDVPAWVNRFLNHWKPMLAIFTESEIWPTLIQQTHKKGIPLLLLNASLSEKSFKRWQSMPKFSQYLLSLFDVCLAQSKIDADRFQQLGAKNVHTSGNIKFAAEPLTYDAEQLRVLKEQTTNRLIWLAASTHEGEELLIAKAHQKLKTLYPNLLTFIVPRHPSRSASITEDLQAHHLQIARRSLMETITEHTDIYLGDTLGELGLFYSLCPIVFIGGSLVPIGGHNPVEPAQLNCSLIWGQYMEAGGVLTPAATIVHNEQELANAISKRFEDPIWCQQQADLARDCLEQTSFSIDPIMAYITPYLTDSYAKSSKVLAKA